MFNYLFYNWKFLNLHLHGFHYCMTFLVCVNGEYVRYTHFSSIDILSFGFFLELACSKCVVNVESKIVH
jgi:hypothetical protein